MCRPLNPRAPEWRPTFNHRLPPPPPSHLHPNLCSPYHPGFVSAYAYASAQSTPLCFGSSPAARGISAAEAGEKPTIGAGTGFAGKKSRLSRRMLIKKFPPAAHPFKSLPPRLRPVERRFAVAPPPPPKYFEWRQRKSVKAHKGGGAARLPPATVVSGGHPDSNKNTTVMVKNIPNQLRRDFMLKFLDDYSGRHGLEYDFFYLPMDFRRKGNFGYAFVNFTTSVAALKFKNLLQDFVWGCRFSSRKVCDVTWARIQGKRSLIERFKNSSFVCDKLDYLPVILDPPRNGSNPNPSPPVVLGSLNPSTLK